MNRIKPSRAAKPGEGNKMYTNKYAQHIAEVIADAEGIDLDEVDVQIEYDLDGNMEPVITMRNEGGRFTARMHDGESLNDLSSWKDA